MDNIYGGAMTFGSAYAMGVPCDGDQAFLDSLLTEENMDEMDRQLMWDEAESFEVAMERDLEVSRLVSSIGSKYLAAVAELR